MANVSGVANNELIGFRSEWPKHTLAASPQRVAAAAGRPDKRTDARTDTRSMLYAFQQQRRVGISAMDATSEILALVAMSKPRMCGKGRTPLP